MIHHITAEQWRKIQKAIEDGDLTELIEEMLDEVYYRGFRDGQEAK